MTIDSKNIGLRFLEAFWDGDIERGLALCANNAVWLFQKSLREPRSASIREAIDWLNETLVSQFDPDSGYTIDLKNNISEGNEIAIEYSATGKTLNGEIYSNDYLVRFTIQDGKIKSIRPYFDTHYVHHHLVTLEYNNNT